MDFERSLKDTVEESFTQYAGAVIQSRALVDVRDCVKPSARQIYYCLYTDGFTADKPFKKTLKAIGSSMRLYIHGDSSCEGIIMRSGQPFSYRYPLVEVEGSYGNQTETGNWAASRYTASRLSTLTNYLVKDTDKYSIDEWVENYDDTEVYPKVFSSLGFYNIVNGSFGIAIGLASSIPQFNLIEVNDALIALLKNPDISEDDILCLPDFATGGTIVNKDEVIQSLKNGTGKAAVIQAKIEYDKKDNCLVVSELPYGVYTNTVCNELEKIAQKDDNFAIVRVNDLTGEKVCIKMYLAKKVDPQAVIDFLYQNTSLQSSYSINMTMLENGRFPKVFGWKEALSEHLTHEESVYKKCFAHQLEEAEYQLKIVNGIICAIQKMENVVQTVRCADSSKTANEQLQLLLGIDADQAKAILDMRLARLTKLEVEDYTEKKGNLEYECVRLRKILQDRSLLHEEMIKRFQEVKEKFGDQRRTKVINKNITKPSNVKKKDEPQDVVFCLDENAYAKVVPLGKFHTNESNVREDKTRTDKLVILYSNKGRAFRLKADAIKPCLNSEKGTAVGPLLELAPDEKIVDFSVNAACPALIMVTKSGRVKVMEAKHIDGTTQNKRGIPMMKLDEEDEIVYCSCIDDKSFMEIRSSGLESRKAIFQISDITPTGKSSSGRIGIKLKDGEHVSYVRLLKDVDKRRISRLGTRGAKM